MGFLNPYLPNNYNPYGQQYQQPVPQPQNFTAPTIRAEADDDQQGRRQDIY